MENTGITGDMETTEVMWATEGDMRSVRSQGSAGIQRVGSDPGGLWTPGCPAMGTLAPSRSHIFL